MKSKGSLLMADIETHQIAVENLDFSMSLRGQ